MRHPSPQRVLRSTSTSTPQKRVRQASPSPVRQKSFRKEVQRPLSPSPSRRSSGEKCRVATGLITGASVKTVGHKSRSPAKGCEMRKEKITCIHRISSKIDEAAAREAVLNEGDLDSAAAMEDIDNPLISLDCFIFL
ncbi:uncharacterized protein LOC111489389 [Cucurbita maxima]|uniref:Uncharacterized protein LOC111489389 n=1 Tax=Cucurbita maxima TaxID=3661 RepID=A0A6J1JZY3_CUCMA|nr:uncharacterized protein LOC111489389 [Cucurbita maxima]